MEDIKIGSKVALISERIVSDRYYVVMTVKNISELKEATCIFFNYRQELVSVTIPVSCLKIV